MQKKVFITGTGTDVGKTYVSKIIIECLRKHGYKTIGLKPVASGAILNNGKLVNKDASILRSVSSFEIPYEKTNPYCFREAIAPHIAAKKHGINMNINSISNEIDRIDDYYSYDISIIEGAGGWHVPINDRELLSDLVIKNQWPVILVVGIRLGCINEAILTCRSFRENGINCLGWISNCLGEKSFEQSENIETLKNYIPYPHMGNIPLYGTVDEIIKLYLIYSSLGLKSILT